MDGETLEFIILTDTHFLPRGQTMYGLDPRARLDAAIKVINRDHPNVSFVVILGDLTDMGERAAYENLAESVSALNAPLLLMMGNHDRRAAFREVFPNADNDGAGFVQALRVLPQASVLTLDTLDEDGNTHAGILCPKRLEFLEKSIREAPTDRPLLLLQHHHSGKVGLRSMDRYNVRNAEEQWAVFQSVGRKPDYMFHGHIHRPIFGLWHGIPYHIQRGVNHQVGFDLHTDVKIPCSLESPDYAFVRASKDGIVVHHRQFLYDGPSYWLNDEEALSGRFAG